MTDDGRDRSQWGPWALAVGTALIGAVALLVEAVRWLRRSRSRSHE